MPDRDRLKSYSYASPMRHRFVTSRMAGEICLTLPQSSCQARIQSLANITLEPDLAKILARFAVLMASDGSKHSAKIVFSSSGHPEKSSYQLNRADFAASRLADLRRARHHSNLTLRTSCRVAIEEPCR